MAAPLFVVEEEVSDMLPEGFLGSPHNEAWQEHAIMLTWILFLLVYMLSLAPILFVSFFFWILAVEWSLDSTLHFSVESFDQEDEDESVGRSPEFCHLMDRLERPVKRNRNKSQRKTLLSLWNESLGLLRFTSESFGYSDVADQTAETKENDLDAPHVHHHELPPLVKADWN